MLTHLLRPLHLRQLQRIRYLSSSIAPGWEEIRNKNGETVYYNKELRRTVRHLPGTEPITPSILGASNLSKSTSNTDDNPDNSIAPTPEEGNEVFIPIDFKKAMKIEGHDSQIVYVTIEHNQCLRAETGAMIYMTEGVEMETTSAGGFMKGVQRIVTGQNFFVSRFTYHGDENTTGTIALGTNFPSKILPVELDSFDGNTLICQKGAFLCGADSIGIEIATAKSIGVGLFGGEGFVLQKLYGEGTAMLRASGALIERDLEVGETLRISSGCLVAFEQTIDYDIKMVSGGIKGAAFGGQGLFLTTLTGPGKVYLQSLPFDRVVSELAGRMPQGGGGSMLPFMMMGGMGNDGSDSGENNTEGNMMGDDAGMDSSMSGEDSNSMREPTWQEQDAANEQSIYGGAGNDSVEEDMTPKEDESTGGGSFMGFFSSIFNDEEDDD